MTLDRGLQVTAPTEATIDESEQKVQIDIPTLRMLSRVPSAVPRLYDCSCDQDLMVSIVSGVRALDHQSPHGSYYSFVAGTLVTRGKRCQNMLGRRKSQPLDMGGDVVPRFGSP